MDCDACPTRPLWQEMWDCILDAADQVTVGNILEETKREEKRGIDRTAQI
jgi:DNA-binding IscR family transcriptional regulator